MIALHNCFQSRIIIAANIVAVAVAVIEIAGIKLLTF